MSASGFCGMMKRRKQSSRKTKYAAYVAASIDGRISLTKSTRPDWTSKEDWKFFQDSLSHADAVVVGRNTYEAAKASLSKRNTFVFSTRFKRIQKRAGVTFLNPATVDVEELLRAYQNVAIVGGGGVYRFMLEKGLMDELYVTVEPLVFGRGKEMFSGGTKTARLRLVSVRKLNKAGTLLLHYRV